MCRTSSRLVGQSCSALANIFDDETTWCLVPWAVAQVSLYEFYRNQKREKSNLQDSHSSFPDGNIHCPRFIFPILKRRNWNFSNRIQRLFSLRSVSQSMDTVCAELAEQISPYVNLFFWHHQTKNTDPYLSHSSRTQQALLKKNSTSPENLFAEHVWPGLLPFACVYNK